MLVLEYISAGSNKPCCLGRSSNLTSSFCQNRDSFNNDFVLVARVTASRCRGGLCWATSSLMDEGRIFDVNNDDFQHSFWINIILFFCTEIFKGAVFFLLFPAILFPHIRIFRNATVKNKNGIPPTLEMSCVLSRTDFRLLMKSLSWSPRLWRSQLWAVQIWKKIWE